MQSLSAGSPSSDMSGRMHRDPLWLSRPLLTKKTSAWRSYYKESCSTAGYTQAGNCLPLSKPFHPHDPDEVTSARASILRRQSSDSDFRVVIFALSYDHDASGSLSQSTWDQTLSVIRSLVEPEVAVQLWVDRIDAASRTSVWGIAQLLPYVLFPVIRIGSRSDAGFWSNMEGLAGVFGRGLFHDRSLAPLVLQNEAPVMNSHFFFSRADTRNARDAVETFYIHLMFGCLSKYRNHHREALERLGRGGNLINLTLADANTFIDILTTNERDSLVGNGWFEILNGHRNQIDVLGWQGLKEWITIDHIAHPIPALSSPFRIKGFVNVYYNDKETMAVVHWALQSHGWTRRLYVGLTHGSREKGKALWHMRVRGYRQTCLREELAEERNTFVSNGLPYIYRFNSFNIQWI